MDNISQRYSNEDTTTSMYLSFDAESTMSTACYKTLEAMSDSSALSVIDVDNSIDQNKTGDEHMSSTLELNNISQNSALKTVKKIEISGVKIKTPLRALPKNILKEYKAICSTPSKEQLLKTVDVTRGSDAIRCVDLGLAFLGIDDEKPAYFPPPSLDAHDENKENALPDIEEMSTLLACSSTEITTSVIEKKVSSMSTVGSCVEEESVKDMNIVDKMDKHLILIDKTTKNLPFVNKGICENPIEGGSNGGVIENDRGVEATAKSNNENFDCADNLQPKEEKTTVVKEAKEKVEKMNKPKIAVLSQNGRLSVCEPNLQMGKPSRILSSEYKRRSLLPTSKKSTISIDAEKEIPLLMSKMLKISNSSKATEAKEKIVNQGPQNTMPIDKRRSLMPTIKSRTSLLTSAAGNKRPFGFAQRMSVVVKTTLNSPARKIARRSALSGIIPPMQRRSANPQTTTLTDSSTVKKSEASLRKSMVSKPSFVNINAQSNLKTLSSIEEKSTQTLNTYSQRKSTYPLSKQSEKDAIAGFSNKKSDISYTCNICKENFRIKSLLDAHKRSHESDKHPPAFIKKPLTIKQPLTGTLLKNQNQCKYCDKKFALTKALHIHLLQNCPKIPPSEKRKLQYTDLNHVEKAQLPNVFPIHNLQSTVEINKNFITKSSFESLNDRKDKSNGINSTASTAPKVKKISAHSGVYRTPSKAIPCHLCKLTFMSVLDYTNHNLSSHGYKARQVNYTNKAVELNNSESNV